MSVQQVQEATTSSLTILHRFSRSTVGSTHSTVPNGVNAFRDVVATNQSTTSSSARTKPTAFKRLKYKLGKKRKNSAEETNKWTSPHISNDPAATLTTESTQPNVTTADSTLCDTASQSMSHDTGEAGAPSDDNPDLNQPDDLETGNPSADDTSHTMSAATLARRIHSLLSSFPPFYTPSTSGSLRFPKASDEASSQAGPGPLADSKLLSLLSSASAMNGSISKGRESVWAILERLGYSPSSKQGGQERSEDELSASNIDDNVEVSSVMICCPLEPTEDTEVEIARSEVVSIDMEEPVYEPVEAPKRPGTGLNLWPFGKGKGTSEIASSPEQTPPSPPKIKEVRVWYPSRTKVSLQAAWWGYRIYLPPPVMRVLSDKSLEAAKRAAMITAALTWLISHIPTTMLPPQLRAVVEVVKGIVPIVGYVGGFIAWSWNTVQSFDKGQGVILSATWLLPIALVPGTWFYTEPPPSNTQSNGDGPSGI